MKHWPFYIALIVFIVLRTIKVKEGNFNIPEQAEVYNTPLDLIHKMTDIMDDKQTNDMVENKNVKYDLTAAQGYLADAKSILATDKKTRDTCKTKLEQVSEQNEIESKKYTVCLGNLSDQTKVYKKCKLDTLPKVIGSYDRVHATLTDTNKAVNDCNKTLRSEKDTVNQCYVDVGYYNENPWQNWWKWIN